MTTEAEPDPGAGTPQAGRWADSPALWAQRQANPESLLRGVVTFTATELNAH